MRQMDVVGVRVEMPSNQPIVLLRETEGERFLPIWIGAAEATAIAFAQQGVVPARPLTHDLFRDVLEGLEHRLVEVRITSLDKGVFFATLVFDNGVEISARPSDGIALGLRTGATVVCADDVLEEAGIAVPDEQEDEVEVEGEQEDFVGTISPDDFVGSDGQGPDAS